MDLNRQWRNWFHSGWHLHAKNRDGVKEADTAAMPAGKDARSALHDPAVQWLDALWIMKWVNTLHLISASCYAQVLSGRIFIQFYLALVHFIKKRNAIIELELSICI